MIKYSLVVRMGMGSQARFVFDDAQKALRKVRTLNRTGARYRIMYGDQELSFEELEKSAVIGGGDSAPSAGRDEKVGTPRRAI